MTELYLMTHLMEIPLQTLGLESDDVTYLENFKEVPVGMAFLSATRICLSYLTGKEQEIDQLKRQIDIIHIGAVGLYFIPRSYFYASLSLLSSYPDIEEETNRIFKIGGKVSTKAEGSV